MRTANYFKKAPGWFGRLWLFGRYFKPLPRDPDLLLSPRRVLVERLCIKQPDGSRVRCAETPNTGIF